MEAAQAENDRIMRAYSKDKKIGEGTCAAGCPPHGRREGADVVVDHVLNRCRGISG